MLHLLHCSRCPDLSWQQAQLSPSLGGLGFRSLALHSSAAFIASFASSGFCSPDNIHMLQAVTRFNAQVHPLESTTAEAVLACPPLQRALSKKLDNHAFQSLLSSSSQVNKARILSVSAPHCRFLDFSNPIYWSGFASGLS